MKKILILRGLPGSSKTTFSLELLKSEPGKWKRTNKDEIRAMIDGGKWSQKNEEFILLVRDRIIKEALKEGFSVIVDDTNFGKHEEHIRQLTAGMDDVEVEVKFFDVPIGECIERDLKRPNSVGSKVIWRMFNQYLRPKREEVPLAPGLPYASIFDIDGSLSQMKNRGPFEWSRVGEDEPVKFVMDLVQRQVDFEDKIIIVTGRDGSCEQETREWLRKHNVPFDHLFIRPAGNTEKDSIIKRRIYEEHIKGKYNVRFVVDDRPQVCRMWYQLGLNLLKVGNPDAEF